MKTLAIFDFDATLYNSPLPTDENRELLEVYRGYKSSGWWGRSESLDIDLFDIRPNPWTLERYNDHKKKGDKLALMTGRIFKIKESVRKVISQDGFTFDDQLYADGRRTIDFKLDMLEKFANSGKYNEIYFYDDRTEHIPAFRKAGDKYKDELGIDFKLFHVIGHTGYELKYGKKLR